jgi:hypothetical protein
VLTEEVGEEKPFELDDLLAKIHTALLGKEAQ